MKWSVLLLVIAGLLVAGCGAPPSQAPPVTPSLEGTPQVEETPILSPTPSAKEAELERRVEQVSKSTSTPTVPPSSGVVSEDWPSYYDESLGIAFQYPPTYTLLLDDPITSGIQLESKSIRISMIANPLCDESVEALAEELRGTGFRESHRIHVEKGCWKGVRLQGKATQIGFPSVDQVIYMVRTPSKSLFTLLAFSKEEKSDFSEVDLIWDSLVLHLDSFTIPPALSMATLEPKGQGYSLRYPRSWVAIVSEGLTWLQDPDNPDSFAMNVMTKSPVANIDKAVDDALDRLRVFKNVVLKSKQKVSLSGTQDAVMLAGTARFEDGGHAVFRTLLALTGDRTYKIQVIADAGEWSSLSPLFDAVFDSFTIDFSP
ncbi:hypothetical protein M1O19_00200 [Dehalococcoidia bacterium]|nr:hypothetical protein [Dehalococcoidia bacterium]MCL0079505.1 hypothetical protein [Dehalococcoidia bacterium]MCL0096951.1 hypothetical protein [Dehalococcoidia bacterium]